MDERRRRIERALRLAEAVLHLSRNRFGTEGLLDQDLDRAITAERG